jgi:hypothetical protein
MQENQFKKMIGNGFRLLMIAVWMITCYYVCRSDAGFRYFEYWILCGFPFGIRKMHLLLIPRNFGIAGGVGILALNAIVGGLIGGVVILFTVTKIVLETVSVIFGSARAKVA